MHSSFLLKALLAMTLLGGFSYSPTMGATEEPPAKEMMSPEEQPLAYHHHGRYGHRWERRWRHRGWHRGCRRSHWECEGWRVGGHHYGPGYYR